MVNGSGAVSVINVCGHHRLGWLLHHEQSPGVDPVINVNIPGRARHPLDQVFHWYNARLVVNACVGARPSKLSPGWRTPLLYCATVQHPGQPSSSTYVSTAPVRQEDSGIVLSTTINVAQSSPLSTWLGAVSIINVVSAVIHGLTVGACPPGQKLFNIGRYSTLLQFSKCR